MRYDAVRGFWEKHSPGAKLNYGIDYVEYLEPGDSISESTWSTEPAGPVLTGDSINSTLTGITVSGGEAGQNYKLTNRIVTANGFIDFHSILLVCE